MTLLVLVLPALLGLLAFSWPDNRTRPRLLLAGAALDAAGVAWLLAHPEPAVLSGYLELDAAGKVVLTTASALFLASAVYAQGYLRRRSDKDNRSSWAACSSCSPR